MKDTFDRLALAAQAGLDKITEEKNEGKTLIVYNSTFVPEELIRATGANTYLLCRGGEAAPAQAAIEYTLECINPLARAYVGYLACGMDRLASMADLVVTAFSDSHMSRMSELLEYKGINVFKIGVPSDWQKKIAFDYYLHALRGMLSRVEETCGCRVDMELAREYFSRSNRVKAALRRVNNLRKSSRIPIGAENIARLNSLSFILNSTGKVEELETFVMALEKAEPVFNEDAPRLLLISRAAPSGDGALLRLLDESGCPVVAELLDEGAFLSGGDVELEGDLLENFAKSRYTRALPANSFQPSWKTRFERVQGLIEEYRISGVVWYQLAYDEIYDMEYSCAAKWLEELGIPLLKLETDYDYIPEKLAVKRSQINSFVKTVKKRRKS